MPFSWSRKNTLGEGEKRNWKKEEKHHNASRGGTRCVDKGVGTTFWSGNQEEKGKRGREECEKKPLLLEANAK